MQHVPGYNLIGSPSGCSVASPFGVAKSGMKRDYVRNTSSRHARGALGALPHLIMLCKASYKLQDIM